MRAIPGDRHNNMISVFIDGSAGTTGLRISERLSGRKDLSLIHLDEAHRKDPKAREEALNAAQVAFLCLPDDAAREAVSLVHGETVIIDTSTAHRTAPGWVYGFPELPGQQEKIVHANWIANPGCHASGFIALVAPLVQAGLLKAGAALTCFSLTGYSGGGKKMIAEYENPHRDLAYQSPRQYGLTQQHKHLKEMIHICGLDTAPVFCPIVADFYSGMEVTVPVFRKDLLGTAEDIRQLYAEVYHTPVVHFESFSESFSEDLAMLPANQMAGRDDMVIRVAGNEDRILLTACFDNLGKGASGAAIQNMNIVLGLDQTLGLNL